MFPTRKHRLEYYSQCITPFPYFQILEPEPCRLADTTTLAHPDEPNMQKCGSFGETPVPRTTVKHGEWFLQTRFYNSTLRHSSVSYFFYIEVLRWLVYCPVFLCIVSASHEVLYMIQ